MLGYGILAGSCFVVKMPQVLKMLQARSAEGLSAFSFEMEQLGLAIHTSYGFIRGLPFNAFGEAAILLVQNTGLLGLLYFYTGAPLLRIVALSALFGSGAYMVVSGWTGQKVSHAHCKGFVNSSA